MRITDGMRYGSIAKNLADLSARQNQASQQALTGRRINAPSDDSIGAAQLVRAHSALKHADAQRAAITSAKGDAEQSEAVLDQANSLFQRAHEIALQGANGSLSADDRTALATEISHLKAELVDLANARGARGYLFGGSKTSSPPFSASGAFSGDNTPQVIQLGSGNPTPVSASGANAFTAAGGRNVFADLDALASALTADDPIAVSATLDNLETSRKQIVREQAQAGLTMNRLDASDSALEQLQLSLGKQEQNAGAADPYDAYSKMTALSQSLERAVSVSRQILDLGSSNRF